MAPAKPDPASETPSDTPVEPSAARKRFLDGEIGWNEYTALESESDDAAAKPAAKPKSGD